eukprot:CAMPEP_0171699664 /NCGR_PEP_ID=MMETSP0991-20121206/10104_1 /TAXON_ID=483369 /ORGANISM="non described non described, Strain CCMP2098" /LENGTH=254 /DNA_ID=CAMNT_0012288797 /DNA_START=156 /DNA_END=917 /DNA_ORIENTATION=+
MSPIASCCRFGEKGQEQSLLEKRFGRDLFDKIHVKYHRNSGFASLSAVQLCPDVPYPQNPMLLAFHSTRWYSACPGNVGVQYKRRATLPFGGGSFPYPFSTQLPFLYQFDWVIGPKAPAKQGWRDPTGKVLPPSKEPHGVLSAALFVQREIPRLLYVTKGLPYTALFEQRVLPLLKTHAAFQSGHRVVVYLGGGGQDGVPDAKQLNRWASLPQVAAVFAENLDMPLEHREKTAATKPSSSASSSSSTAASAAAA